MATGLERTNSKSVECLQRGLFDVDGEETVFATNGNKAAAKRRHVKRSEASPSADAEERLLEALNSVSARLDARIALIESAVLKLREELIAVRTIKEFYTTAEVAGILGKRPTRSGNGADWGA